MGIRAANLSKLCLQNPQQFACSSAECRRFRQKQRAPVGRLEAAIFCDTAPVKAPSHDEELLSRPQRNRRRSSASRGSISAPACVNRLRNDLFAGAGLPCENRGVGGARFEFDPNPGEPADPTI